MKPQAQNIELFISYIFSVREGQWLARGLNETIGVQVDFLWNPSLYGCPFKTRDDGEQEDLRVK